MTTDDNGMIHATDGKFAGTVNREAESPLTEAPTVGGLSAEDLEWFNDNVEAMAHQRGLTPYTFATGSDYDAWLDETTHQVAALFLAASPLRDTETSVPPATYFHPKCNTRNHCVNHDHDGTPNGPVSWPTG